MIKGFLTDFLSELYYLSAEMAPYLLLGFLFAGILHIYIRKETIAKHLGGSGLKQSLYAALLGIPLPLCSCGVIPTGISFFKDGASKPATVSFLISTPQTGVDSIMVTYSLLGWPLAVIRPIVALFTGVAGGLLTGKIAKKDDQKSTMLESSNEEIKGNRFMAMLRYAFIEFMEDIAKWLVIGLAIAALIAVLLPDDFFTMYMHNSLLSMLLVLVASAPLYVCATGSVPIAAVLMMKGLSPGAALVFLMAGPATNAATMTVIGKAMGRRTLIAYLASIIIGSLFFGMVIDLFLPASLFTAAFVHEGHGEHFLPEWFKLLSLVLLIIFAGYALLRKYGIIKKKKAETTIDMSDKIKVKVGGMTCNHCKMNVENNLKRIEGIGQVEANPETEEVYLDGENIDFDEIKKTVEGLGYQYKGKLE